MIIIKKWAVPIIIALVLNTLLISIIPTLVKQVPEKTDMEFQSVIDVVRLRKPKPPPMPPEKKEPPKEEIKQQPKNIKSLAPTPKPKITQKLDLPFDTKLDLPSFEGGFELPILSSFELPEIKSEYGLDEIDQPLMKLVAPDPIHPMAAKRRGISGAVRVNILVNEEGFVSDAKVVEAEPEGVFENSAIRTVLKWRFSPGTVDGVPVKVRASLQFTFSHVEDE